MAATPRTADRLLLVLQARGAQTAGELAAALGVTTLTVRRQLDALAARGAVRWEDRGGHVGRPARHWSLAASGAAQLPDPHATLAVRLLDSIAKTLGAATRDEVALHFQKQAEAAYRREIPRRAQLGEKLQILARLRDDEGYVAGVERDDERGWRLVEQHCPIRAAAENCQALCTGELRAFRAVLGPGASVRREEHVLRGDARCAYVVRATAAGRAHRNDDG